MLRGLINLFAGFTSLIASVILVHSVLVDRQEGAAFWIAQKILASTAVLVIGVLTSYYLWRRTETGPRTRLLLWTGALILVPLGLVTVVVTIRLAYATGDWEMYMVAAGTILVLQGLSTMLHLADWAPGKA